MLDDASEEGVSDSDDVSDEDMTQTVTMRPMQDMSDSDDAKGGKNKKTKKSKKTNKGKNRLR